MIFYQFTLPMPVSINKAHTVRRGGGGNRFDKFYEEKQKEVEFTRSKEYREWVINAGVEWRKRFPYGVQKLTGRIRVDYCFVWVDRARGTELSDIGNREKVLSDFLQGKCFENDRTIDEQGQYRRLVGPYDENGKPVSNHVIIRVSEIPDRRYDDPALIFSALDQESMLPTVEPANKKSDPIWDKLRAEAAKLSPNS